MIFNIPTNTNILNEVYFGKTPEILAIEKQLDKFRNKYMGSYYFNLNVNSDPDLLKLNRMFEDYFGFGCFSITIHNQSTVNAFTIPISMSYDQIINNKNLIATTKGFKYNKDADYSLMMFIYSSLIFNKNYTTPEILAIMLHEIGHNFYSATTDTGVLAWIYVICNMLKLLINNMNAITLISVGIIHNNDLKKLYNKSVQYLYKHSKLCSIILNTIHFYFDAKENVLTFIDRIKNFPKLGFQLYGKLPGVFLKKILNPMNIFMPLKYNDERFADNFATMYGYGAELSSGLEKLSSFKYNPSIFENIPLASNIYALNINVRRIILSIFDEHPIELVRAQDQIKMLERELQKEDLDPKIRKTIQADIKTIKRVLNDLTDTTINLKNKAIIRNAYYKILYKFASSKDIKELILRDDESFDKYDIIYKEKLQ